MALVKCEDCGHDVSDRAQSCPKCGAPMPKILKEDETECPFCRTTLHVDALVCPSCDARKGYTTAKGRIYGKAATIFWGIILPGFFGLLWGVGLMTSNHFIGGLVLMVIFSIPIVLSVYRLKTGPVWYKAE